MTKPLATDRETYIKLLRSTKREGIENLIDFLENSDFFIAPASTIYHNCFEGGLCRHSLDVYINLLNLKGLYMDDPRVQAIPQESYIITALLHDLSKTNFYEPYVQNKKLYTPNGSKYDELGAYDWVSISSYKVKEPQLRFVGLDHCVNSVLIAEQYINMTLEEKVSVYSHHATFNSATNNKDLSEIYTRYQLALLLHMADLVTTYNTETRDE